MNIIMETNEKITTSKNAAKIFEKVLEMRQEEDKHKECFYTMGLNSNNTVIYIDLITMGTVNQGHVSIREVIRQAIIKNAVSIILCHNHPSGNYTPSSADKMFTNEVKKASEILELKVLDHLIIGKEGFYSFADEGIL